MKTLHLSLSLFVTAALVGGCATQPSASVAAPALVQPAGLRFAVAQLAGSWAESTNPSPVCSNNEIRYRFEFSPDGKGVTVKLNRIHPTEIGDKDEIAATIVDSTETTLTIAYGSETRRRDDGSLMEWQLVVVAPGVYRWRETSWPPQSVNVVVGVRCSAA